MCCGQSRSRVATSGRAVSPMRKPAPSTSGALYEYTGKTGMTVIGPISGARYRFDRPGARLQIDGRDVLSIRSLPNLRRVG
jgi:hypothetical protein